MLPDWVESYLGQHTPAFASLQLWLRIFLSPWVMYNAYHGLFNIAWFQLMYSLLNVAFQIDFTRHFGRSGFMAFWMLNWAGMMAVYVHSLSSLASLIKPFAISGLALESMITLLTTRFIPFFMITWILSKKIRWYLITIHWTTYAGNVSVCIAPIQVLPGIYRYGYAAPFYNLSRGFRTIAFSTKNQRTY